MEIDRSKFTRAENNYERKYHETESDRFEQVKGKGIIISTLLTITRNYMY